MISSQYLRQPNNPLEMSRSDWINQAKDHDLRQALGKIWDTVRSCEHGHAYRVCMSKKGFEIVCEDDQHVVETVKANSKTHKIWASQFGSTNLELSFDLNVNALGHVHQVKPHGKPTLLTRLVRFFYMLFSIGPQLEHKLKSLGMTPEEGYLHRKEWMAAFIDEISSKDPDMKKWFGDDLKKTLTDSLSRAIHYTDDLNEFQIHTWEHYQTKKELSIASQNHDLQRFDKAVNRIQWQLLSSAEWKMLLNDLSEVPQEHRAEFYEHLFKRLHQKIAHAALGSQERSHLENLITETANRLEHLPITEPFITIKKSFFDKFAIYQLEIFRVKQDERAWPFNATEHFLVQSAIKSWCTRQIEEHSYATSSILKSLFDRKAISQFKIAITQNVASLGLHFTSEQKNRVLKAIEEDSFLPPAAKERLKEQVETPSKLADFQETLLEVLEKTQLPEDQKIDLLRLIESAMDTSNMIEVLEQKFEELIGPMTLEYLEDSALCSSETCRRAKLLLDEPKGLGNDLYHDVQTIHLLHKEMKELRQLFIDGSLEATDKKRINEHLEEKQQAIDLLCARIGQGIAFSPKSALGLKKLATHEHEKIIVSALGSILERLNESPVEGSRELLWQFHHSKILLGQQLGEGALEKALESLRQLESTHPWLDDLQMPEKLSKITPYTLLVFQAEGGVKALSSKVDPQTARTLELMSSFMVQDNDHAHICERTRKELAPLIKATLGNSAANKSLSTLHNEIDAKRNLLHNESARETFIGRLAESLLPKPKDMRILPDTILRESVLNLRLLSFKLGEKKLDQLEIALNKLTKNLEKAQAGQAIDPSERLSAKELASLGSFVRLNQIPEDDLDYSYSPIGCLREILGKDDPLMQRIDTLLNNVQVELRHLNYWTGELASAHYQSGSVLAESGRKKELYTGRKLSGEEKAIYSYLSALRSDGYLHGAKFYKERGEIGISHVVDKLKQVGLDLELLIESDVWEVDPVKLLPKWTAQAFEKALGSDWKQILRESYYKAEDALHRSYDRQGLSYRNDNLQRVMAGVAALPFSGASHHLEEAQDMTTVADWMRENGGDARMICSEFASRSTLDAFIKLDTEIYPELVKGLEISIEEDITALRGHELPQFLTLETLAELVKASEISPVGSTHFLIEWNEKKLSVSKKFMDALTTPSKKNPWFDPSLQKELRYVLQTLGYKAASLDISMKLLTKSILDLPYAETEDFRYIHPNRMVDLLAAKHCISRKGLPPRLLEVIDFPSGLL